MKYLENGKIFIWENVSENILWTLFIQVIITYYPGMLMYGKLVQLVIVDSQQMLHY